MSNAGSQTYWPVAIAASVVVGHHEALPPPGICDGCNVQAGFHQIVCRAKAIAAWRTASFLRPRRSATFRIFEDYGVDTTRRKPFDANWPAVSSSGRGGRGIVSRCLNRHLWNQHAVNRTSLGDLHQAVNLILG